MSKLSNFVQEVILSHDRELGMPQTIHYFQIVYYNIKSHGFEKFRQREANPTDPKIIIY